MAKESENIFSITALSIIILLIFINSAGCSLFDSEPDAKKETPVGTLKMDQSGYWPMTVFVGQPTNFSCTISDNRQISGEYIWDFGDGQKTTTTVNSAKHTYFDEGYKNLKVTFRSSSLPSELTAEMEVRIISESPVRDVIFGRASYYGNGVPYGGLSDNIKDGDLTSSGEPYDNDGLTAATWEIYYGVAITPHEGGTDLLVINTENGNSVEVRFNDRGPYKFPYKGTPEVNNLTDPENFNDPNLIFEIKEHSRLYPSPAVILDLTPNAFSKLSDLSKGLINVRIQVLD